MSRHACLPEVLISLETKSSRICSLLFAPLVPVLPALGPTPMQGPTVPEHATLVSVAGMLLMFCSTLAHQCSQSALQLTYLRNLHTRQLNF